MKNRKKIIHEKKGNLQNPVRFMKAKPLHLKPYFFLRIFFRENKRRKRDSRIKVINVIPEKITKEN